MMKFLIVCFAIVAVAYGAGYPNRNGKCDFQCANLNVPVCAYDGNCVHTFKTQCVLDHYNCIHPQRQFRPISKGECDSTYNMQCTSYYHYLNDLFIIEYGR